MNRFVVGSVLLVALAGCAEDAPPPAKPAVVGVPGDAIAGKSIAERNCFGCHRADGAGAAPGIPHLAAQHAAYLVQSMHEYADGKRTHAVLREMTPQLSDTDARKVAAYYAALPPILKAAPKTALSASPYERGKASAAACAACHGADGNSTIAGTPSLAGQQPQYLLSAIAEYHGGDRSTANLATMLRGTSNAEMQSLALFYASQTPASRTPPPTGDAGAGESLAVQCAGCHGLRGISNDAATPTLAAQDAQYLVKALRAYGSGRRHDTMKRQVAKLSEKDLRDLAAYYAAQKSRPAERGQDFISQLADKCNRCHGDATHAAASPVPRLGGQDKDYLVMALRAYRDDRRESSAMHKMSLPFSEAAIEGIAVLYASQPAKQ